MLLGLAAFAAAILNACSNTDSRELLAPTASQNLDLPLKPPIIVGPIRGGDCSTRAGAATIICRQNANAEISAGDRVTCSLRRNGAAWCWGSNVNGILGNGSSTATTTAVPVAVAGGHLFSSIAVGMTHACAVEQGTNQAYCWGMNDVGQLGVPKSQVAYMATTPVAVSGGNQFSSISAGFGLTCGVSNTQTLCWGATMGVNVGTTPVARADLSGSTAAVTVGNQGPGFLNYASCGLRTDSSITCRPYYYAAQLAQGGTADHFCMLDANGAASCWGNNYYGELGDSTYSYPAGGSKTYPVTVRGNHSFQTIAVGAQATCGLSGGAAFCWGWNQWQQLGTNTFQTLASVPQAVTMPANTTFTKIAVGYGHVCAIDPAGVIWCWGRNDNSQGSSAGPQGLPNRVEQTLVF